MLVLLDWLAVRTTVGHSVPACRGLRHYAGLHLTARCAALAASHVPPRREMRYRENPIHARARPIDSCAGGVQTMQRGLALYFGIYLFIVTRHQPII